MVMQGVFITGTNTNVGKTYTGVLLARKLRKDGITVIPRKPIESGCEKHNNELIPGDAIALKEAAQYKGSTSEVCPYRFEPPISPVRAAHLANRVLSTEQLVQICIQGSEDGFTLVEGAGGFYSPLAEDGLNADLATALQLPIILVTGNNLGCLNEVMLSVEAIKMRGLHLSGVVVTSMQETIDDQMSNVADLREMVSCPVISIPYGGDESDLPDDFIEQLKSHSVKLNSPRLVG